MAGYNTKHKTYILHTPERSYNITNPCQGTVSEKESARKVIPPNHGLDPLSTKLEKKMWTRLECRKSSLRHGPTAATATAPASQGKTTGVTSGLSIVSFSRHR